MEVRKRKDLCNLVNDACWLLLIFIYLRVVWFICLLFKWKKIKKNFWKEKLISLDISNEMMLECVKNFHLKQKRKNFKFKNITAQNMFEIKKILKSFFLNMKTFHFQKRFHISFWNQYFPNRMDKTQEPNKPRRGKAAKTPMFPLTNL